MLARKKWRGPAGGSAFRLQLEKEYSGNGPLRLTQVSGEKEVFVESGGEGGSRSELVVFQGKW